MNTTPIWQTFIENQNFPRLEGDEVADVVIIGGGITGLTTALLLMKEGFNVSIVESMRVCGGTTSHSTGNLYVTLDQNFSTLKKKYDLETIKQIVSARSLGINLIEDTITQYGIDCDFERVPWNLYSASEESNKQIDDEYHVGIEAGLKLIKSTLNKSPYHVQTAITLEDQAQFHPMKYGQGLVRILSESNKVKIFEHSPAIDFKTEHEQTVVFTPMGKISARYVIHATHTPKGVMMVQTLLGPYREYGIAFKLKYASHPKGIFWGYYGSDQHISTRVYNHKGEHYLLVVGEPHKVGQAHSGLEKIKHLEEFAAKHFVFDKVDYAWSAQHYRPADLLPYIGRSHQDNTFVATGFSTDGLTWANVSAQIISDKIMGRANPYFELFDYKRFAPLKSAMNFVKENANVVARYLLDIPGHADAKNFESVGLNEGKILEMDGQKLAVHRDTDHNLHVCSAICTHLSCVVNWNDAEKSWDCPCHGSRFSLSGEVLEGPATQNLDSIIIEGQHVKLRESSWTSPL